jgi:ATP-binding cassette, subfamily B, bacterial PglK
MYRIFFKIFSLLNKRERFSYYLFFYLILISSIIDLFGIASIFPFIFLVSNPNIIESNQLINFFYISLINLEVIQIKKDFLILSGVLALFLLIISITFRTLSQILVTRFCLNFEKTINLNLVRSYLSKPYIYFLDKNSTDIYKKIITQTRDIIDKTIYPSLNLISHSTIIIIILLFLIYFNPYIFSSIFTFIFIFFFISFYLFKKKLRTRGQSNINLNLKNMNTLFNIFSSIKNTKVNQLERNLFQYYSTGLKNYIKNQIFVQTIASLPRQFLELIGFVIIIITILINLKNENSILEYIPIVTVYSLAGYRLLPSLQQVYFAITNIEFSHFGFEELLTDLKNLKHQNNFKEQKKKFILPFSKNIYLKNISFKYANSKNLILNNINLNIKSYSRIGILGPSGSGKTTLLDIMMGLIDPLKGKILVDSTLLTEKKLSSWQSNIGYVTQDIKLFNESIEDNIINLDRENYNTKLVEEVSKVSLIHDFIVTKLSNKYQTIIGDDGSSLSGGQKQRVGIAKALYRQPKLLILDEATNSLDQQTEDMLLKSLCNYTDKKITLILVSHSLKTLKYCDKIYSLDKGNIKLIK